MSTRRIKICFYDTFHTVYYQGLASIRNANILYIGTISIEIRTNPLKDAMGYELLTKHRTHLCFILIKIPQNECQSETQ